ncbi:MAG: M81 family metallopeptidase [Candidatus Latescibacteria bacterium]|nr:M81 family metallopeptidase [Candidatus Latescibacterota bacterium]
MRIAIGGMMHESNTFSRTPTDRAAFESGSLTTGDRILPVWGPAHHEMGGFIEGAQRFGYDLYPTLMAVATPSGRVTDDALGWLTDELIDRLSAGPSLDGLLLALHGAMVAESYPDGDGEVLRRLRAALGSDFPIVTTLDFHTNVSEQMVGESTALVIYQTCPHVDQRECGLRAAELITRIVTGEVRPTQALAKPPLLFNILFQNTSREPLRPILDAARERERRPKVLRANIAAGYQYADVHEIGPSVVVVTDNDPDLARSEAASLSDRLWACRDRLVLDLPDAATAVECARQSDAHPVVLVEMGDNIGGGSAGDSTVILSDLLRQDAEGWVAVLYDPEAVHACVQAGISRTVDLMVGGKTDDLHGLPVRIAGRVRSLHDGRYEEPEVRHGGARYHDQGLTAVVEATLPGLSRTPNPEPRTPSFLILTSKREPPFSLRQLTSLGIDPARQRVLVVKAAIAYRAAYEPIAGRIIEVDTPGLTAVNPARFTFRHIRRPLWPIDEISDE